MKDATRAGTLGRRPHAHAGTINPPVYHAATILAPSFEEYTRRRGVRYGDEVTYGVHGTPGTYAFEEAIAALEGGHRTRLCSTGLQALAAGFLCCLRAGDHVLLTDSCYGPVRSIASGILARMGVESTYYDPHLGGEIRTLFRPNTRMVLVEAPGSWTFEMQDIPAIAEEAKKAGILVMMDNTWASPLYCKPFTLGVDISVQAITKYVGGHSDLVMGTVTATQPVYDEHIQPGWYQMGLSGSPDDVYLAMRGLRSLPVRMQAHWQAGLKMGEWLLGREEIVEVIHPAMPHDPGHALWKRDFLGAASLFAFVIDPRYGSDAHMSALLDHLEHYGMGASWGGFESLLIPTYPERIRSATRWPAPGRPKGQCMRIHVGLEDTDDLIADLAAGLDRMRRV
ncbi:MAG: cystathionine beta-lyase [Pseudomonadota bacterium]